MGGIHAGLPDRESASYPDLQRQLQRSPRRWLITGAAGFIGSNLVEKLLRLGQTVVALDNFATGSRRNLEEATGAAVDGRGSFHLIEGDIRDLDACRTACHGVDFVLHHAALGSVPRSLADPIATNATNVSGFLNMLVAARDAAVRRFVYATSSSVYGDDPLLPKVEERTGNPLSPYAVSKVANELYAGVFERSYGLRTVGLRYFNVFGRRQDPDGPYAAVIPRWIANLLAGEPCLIHGDGETSRDFCYVENNVQANLLAALAEGDGVTGRVYNIACGAGTTLSELYLLLRDGVATVHPEVARARPIHDAFRAGDIRHSLADISAARELLGYTPSHDSRSGLTEALAWYLKRLAPRKPGRSEPLLVSASR